MRSGRTSLKPSQGPTAPTQPCSRNGSRAFGVVRTPVWSALSSHSETRGGWEPLRQAVGFRASRKGSPPPTGTLTEGRSTG